MLAPSMIPAPAGVDLVNAELAKAGIAIRPSDAVMAQVFAHYAEGCHHVPDEVKLLQGDNPLVDLIPGFRRKAEGMVYRDHAKHLAQDAFNDDLDACLARSAQNADFGCDRHMLPNGASVPGMSEAECQRIWRDGRPQVALSHLAGRTDTDTHADAIMAQGGVKLGGGGGPEGNLGASRTWTDSEAIAISTSDGMTITREGIEGYARQCMRSTLAEAHQGLVPR